MVPSLKSLSPCPACPTVFNLFKHSPLLSSPPSELSPHIVDRSTQNTLSLSPFSLLNPTSCLVTFIILASLLLSDMRWAGDKVPTLKLVDSSLRLLAIPLSVASIWLTVTNHQDNNTYGRLDFSNFTGLKYTAFISAISAGYALLSAISSWIKPFSTKAWAFFVSDQVGAYLMVTSGAAVVEIMYLGYNGDRTVSWSEACTSYGRFCSRLKLTLALHAIAIGCFFALAVISAYRVFSRFEPPVVPSKEVEEERN